MPVNLAVVSADSLPVWDTFEAVFFLIAGLSVGVVLGVLFPSLWRTFRRRFRKSIRYAPYAEKMEPNVLPTVEVLKDLEDKEYGDVDLIEAFVLARYLFQVGQARQSVGLYIRILTDEKVSKHQTHMAYFELAQVYLGIGLQTRALDTALELFHRKPKSTEVLKLVLKICSMGYFPERLNQALRVYKGVPNGPVRMSIAHALCEIGELSFDKERIKNALDLARSAVRWERSSGRAMLLLWKATSLDLWKRASADPKTMWAALATDLEALTQILRVTGISSAASCEYLAEILCQMSHHNEILSCFYEIKTEFDLALKLEKLDEEDKNRLYSALFYSALFGERSSKFQKGVFYADIFSILVNSPFLFNFIAQLREPAYTGYSSHRCCKCRAFYSQFAWKCVFCGSEESLQPELNPNVVSLLSSVGD